MQEQDKNEQVRSESEDLVIATGKKHSLFPFSSEMIDRNTPTPIKRFHGKQPVKRNNCRSRRSMIFVIDHWSAESFLTHFIISMKSPTINQVSERFLAVSSFNLKLHHRNKSTQFIKRTNWSELGSSAPPPMLSPLASFSSPFVLLPFFWQEKVQSGRQPVLRRLPRSFM